MAVTRYLKRGMSEILIKCCKRCSKLNRYRKLIETKGKYVTLRNTPTTSCLEVRVIFSKSYSLRTLSGYLQSCVKRHRLRQPSNLIHTEGDIKNYDYVVKI